MKSITESPNKYGWIDTMIKGQTELIPWSKRASAYAFAKRHGIVITIRGQPDGWAKVVRLDLEDDK